MVISAIDELNETPLPAITGEQLAACKCGQDTYSRWPLAELTDAVPAHVFIETLLACESEAEQAVALRWMLRGLEPQRAIMRAANEFRVGAEIVSKRRAIAKFCAENLG
jgi:hypothetical protein